MEPTEIEAAIGEVARKHNILIDPGDPLLVVMTLNEVILARMLVKQRRALESALDQILASAAQQTAAAKEVAGIIITGAADYVAGELREAVAALKADLLATIDVRKLEVLLAARGAQRTQIITCYLAMTCVAALFVILGGAIGFVIQPTSLEVAPIPPASMAARR